MKQNKNGVKILHNMKTKIIWYAIHIQSTALLIWGHDGNKPTGKKRKKVKWYASFGKSKEITCYLEVWILIK